MKDIKVPNAPCGVERFVDFFLLGVDFFVPNAPCGVEREVF